MSLPLVIPQQLVHHLLAARRLGVCGLHFHSDAGPSLPRGFAPRNFHHLVDLGLIALGFISAHKPSNSHMHVFIREGTLGTVVKHLG